MPTSPEDFEAMRQRTEAAITRGKLRAVAAKKGIVIDPVQCDAVASSLVNAVALVEGLSGERKLHDAIMYHCDNQWPRWKYIHARMDKRSTVAVGSQDFTVFLPDSRTLCVECKRKGSKPTTEQLAWHKEMKVLGHKVHVIYSLEDFLEIVK